jgi:hypothetical protein
MAWEASWNDSVGMAKGHAGGFDKSFLGLWLDRNDN